MSEITPGYLSKRGGRWRPVKLFDLALLLFFMYQASKDEDIGFEDTHETMNSVEKKLNKTVFIEPRLMEAGLWAANLMNEQGKWWHPKKLAFDEWTKKLLGRDGFNKIYNFIVKEDGNGGD